MNVRTIDQLAIEAALGVRAHYDGIQCSKRHDQQDATGVMERYPPVGNVQINAPTTPTNGQTGFSPGCLWQNYKGASGSFLYVNIGTNLSSLWLNIDGPASATTSKLSVITALNTVGNGTITAAGIVGGTTTRGGTQTAVFTDTTDTAANIIAGITNWSVGQSFKYTYVNNTAYAATITNGLGVTLSGITTIQPNSYAEYLVTYTGTGAVSIVGVESGPYVQLPATQYATGTTTTTFTAGQLTGAQFTVYASTAATPGTITTRTATQMFGDIPNAQLGMSYILRIINTVITNTLTVGLGTNVTNPNSTTLTVAPTSFRDFIIVFPTATTATITAVGTGTTS